MILPCRIQPGKALKWTRRAHTPHMYRTRSLMWPALLAAGRLPIRVPGAQRVRGNFLKAAQIATHMHMFQSFMLVR